MTRSRDIRPIISMKSFSSLIISTLLLLLLLSVDSFVSVRHVASGQFKGAKERLDGRMRSMTMLRPTNTVTFLQSCVKSCEVMLIVSADIGYENISNLKKLVISNIGVNSCDIMTESKSSVVEAIDSSPFSIISPDLLFPANYCVLVKDKGGLELVRDTLSKWTKTVRRTEDSSGPGHLVLCSKLFAIKVDI